ncbi:MULTISPECIES: putative toxin-antitoxin system toxin component, PIN family [unclassified Rathayibacter]|uniref:PIN domain-containing protein n=1 Tax=unclassified Rathayibacter TaxID=2609250 RepID=UPI000F4C5841|nr:MULTISPECIES: PIN domain-containing protein [unclassified Rathayibacter]ROP48588.1 PIN domain-containing protein [Rathayibacter sp. PhB186]ROS49737.1 PIN domain-containing protein [Rathayibacter sp. PhB185]
MRFPAFFDTNVLYGALLNDFVLELADRGLYRPLWSKDVLFELAKNLVKNGEDPLLVEKRVGTMERYFADAMVSGYDDLVPTMANDEKDRHVLAAAVRGGAEVLVTFNTKDFPPASVEPFDLEIVHPDAFLLDQLDLYRADAPRSCRTRRGVRLSGDDRRRLPARAHPRRGAGLRGCRSVEALLTRPGGDRGRSVTRRRPDGGSRGDRADQLTEETPAM